jgi:DNA repair exonuclease SbcCD nuclease subunit
MKFLHAADIHLDAQLQLAVHGEEQPELLRCATRLALSNLVSLALEERVDFVLIAGDLFDSDASDMSSFRFAAAEFQRLGREQIPVYLIRGNHDSLGERSQSRIWPKNVYQFRADQPETLVIETLGVALHGQSFGTRSVTVDLAAKYPERLPGCFNIGLLHTSLSGSSQHETYAPTRPDLLKLRGYDYWALGHVHTFQQVTEEPAIVFSGCIQGRHINEPGAKGCALVTVEDGVPSVSFRPLDVLRWARVPMELRPDDGPDELMERVRARAGLLVQESEGRPVAMRVDLRGRCQAHHWLVSELTLEELAQQLDVAARDAGEVWIEGIDLRTRPALDVESLRESPEPLGAILRDLEALRHDPARLGDLMAEVVQPLRERAGREVELAGMKLNDPELLRTWLDQAEGLVLDGLADAEAAT